jgi:hypothetical protein
MEHVIQNSKFRMQAMRDARSSWRLHFASCILHFIAALVAFASITSAAEPTLIDAAERGDRAAVSRLLSKGAIP